MHLNRIKKIRLAGLFLMLILLAGCTGSKAEEKLDIWFFDAGKADSFLFDCSGKYVLMDCGKKGFGKELVKSLSAKGIKKIDYLIITHFDKDHVGGAARVLEYLEVGCVLQNDREKDSDEYEAYVKALNDKKMEAVIVRDEMSFEVEGVKFTVHGGSGKYSEDKSNNCSLVTMVEYEGKKLLFPGDARTERLREEMEKGTEDIDVLKVAYHGREEEALEEMLEKYTPEEAVITSSEEEPESETTTEALEKAGVITYLTREGTVRIRIENGEITTEQ